jgi:anti-sigma-K factor RskA
MTHDEIQAELSAYALGALDADERPAVEAHLAAGCDACRRELAQWQEVVGSLALLGQDVPAPDLKPALLRRARARRGSRVVTLPRWSLAPLALAAGVLLALGVARELGWRDRLAHEVEQATALRGDLETAQDAVQRLGAALAAKEQDVAALRAALASVRESLAIVQAPGLQLVRLRETREAAPAEGHVLLSAESRRALFYAFDLPAVTPDKAYELWWITEKDGPVNAGVFRPDARGLGRVETTFPTDAGAIQAAAVTIEPAAGVAKPTGPMVLLGTVPAQS